MIVFVGFMGAGKTTIGRLVAARLGLPFIDTDDVVARRAGRSIRRIFEEEGEPAFRDMEREVVLEVLSDEKVVVAVGGGALKDPLIRTALKPLDVVYLKVSYGEAARRVGHDPERPMLQRDIRALYDERIELYESIASHTFDTDGKAPSEIALDIAKKVAGVDILSDRAQRVVVSLGPRSYEVTIGRDLLQRVAASVQAAPDAERAFILTHPVLKSRAEELSEAFDDTDVIPHILEVTEGEEAKSLDTVSHLVTELADRGATKRDAIVGLGGGVVCDVAGFVSSIYARGMHLVLVPTSLLAQVDAAIGGKNGVNLRQAKNLVGTVRQPTAVFCDVELLLSLPREEMQNAMAEVVKYGLIADPELLDLAMRHRRPLFEGSAPELIDVVTRCVGIKAHYVMADEFDEGARQQLNYGHTFGHAIEAHTGYGSISHGQAVSLGMMAAAYLAEDLGRITEREVDVHRRALLEFDLPVRADLDIASLERAWKLDKKYRRGVRFVLMDHLGSVEHGVSVPRDAIERAVRRLAR